MQTASVRGSSRTERIVGALPDAIDDNVVLGEELGNGSASIPVECDRPLGVFGIALVMNQACRRDLAPPPRGRCGASVRPLHAPRVRRAR